MLKRALLGRTAVARASRRMLGSPNRAFLQYEKRPRKLAPPGSSVSRKRGVDRHLVLPAAASSRRTGLPRPLSLPKGTPHLTPLSYRVAERVSSRFRVLYVTTTSRLRR